MQTVDYAPVHIAHTTSIGAAKMLSEACAQLTGAECNIVKNLDGLYRVTATTYSAEQEHLAFAYAMGCQDQRIAIGLDNGAR